MYGAILGDIIGSPYEFDRSGKTKDFPLFSPESRFTDDTVMTVAVADAFLSCPAGASNEAIRRQLIRSMQRFGRLHPGIGYGAKFFNWLMTVDPQPYGSWGNGSAMRVSSAGWLFGDLETVLKMARLSAEVSHDHPEAIKGAQATAAAVFLARTGCSKEEIRTYIESTFGYDLSRTCDEIRPGYRHDVSCRGTVPEAITAFLEGTSFEDVIRTAVSLGGDCDTLTCIAGSMAEAFYGVPDELKQACRQYLSADLAEILQAFDTHR
jgi:ADP-ribosylglycohydrolase